ncbi:signal peptidase I [Nocardioides mangrovicus]|uniref:Signal peptidase I n=1 Tax=Nocardioides mangrovicus TaxID=2478913 RepID=A0A3L8P3E6_9ACTN|nr:signal peptidase I [Nocardioides mangrovicus]RLV49614.1 signal peptidase I [Nocardioides mangrovicus]
MVLTGSALWARRAVQVLMVFGLGFVLTYAGLGWHAGYRPYIVHTGSMTPTYRSGDLVLIKRHEAYAVGSVITFSHGEGDDDLVTHRIVKVTAAGISTKGDANATDDAWTIAPDQVRGVAVGSLPAMGYVARFLQVPAGIGALLTSVLSALLLWGLFFPAPAPVRAPRARARRPRIPRQRSRSNALEDLLRPVRS